MRISRRDFVKSATASGIALSITPLAIAEEPNFAARETLPGRQGWNPAATGVGRIDGVAKVTGAKRYASDFRAADLPNWSEGAGRGGAQSALGACDQLGDRRLDQRACGDPPSRRGCACHLPLRSMAGCARIVGHRAANQWENARWKDGQ